MRTTALSAVAFSFACALAFAEDWKGILVDSKCYGAEERNVNPTDTLTSVDRDRNQEIRYCSPNAKTKTFAIILPDGRDLRLDSGGDAKAADLVRKIGKRSMLEVSITGGVNGRKLRVDSISPAR